MAKKKTKKTKEKPISNTRLPEVFAIIFVAVSIFYIVSMFSESTGAIGGWLKTFTLGLLSVSGYILPFMLLILGTNLITEKRIFKYRKYYIVVAVMMIVFSAFLQLFADFTTSEALFETIGDLYTDGTDLIGGGVIGGLLTLALSSLLGPVGTGILYGAVYLICAVLLFNISVIQLFNSVKDTLARKREERKAKKETQEIEAPVISTPKKKAEKVADTKTDDFEFDGSSIQFSGNIEHEVHEDLIIEDMDGDDIIIGPDMVIEDAPQNGAIDAVIEDDQVALSVENDEDDDPFAPEYTEYLIENYDFPSLDLLKEPDKNVKGVTEQELMDNARKLVETLKSFGVQTKVLQVCKGPAITRYELQPMAGVKVSKIVGLSDDIALNLAAPAVRIEAPIPGKAAIGIEIPNKAVDMVSMREVLDTEEFRNHPSNLAVALGKDISGQPIIVDLAKMPHLLIAGATGSGKSVCINSIITSIMYKAHPNDVKLILIDPKVEELSVYNGIPHLDTPVVTKAKKASGALSWAVTEMMKRYDMFSEAKVRDIKGYNEYIKDKGYPQMPQIVIIIDELADLMMVAPNEVEDSICRLAQLARAAGMHLNIATQRPSVNVITGIIKANIPSRIAFAVTSQIDSRTILDMGGAEKLLGRGDMLYHPYGSNKPQRIQGAFISDNEVEALVSFVKNGSEANYNANIAEHIEKEPMNDKQKEEMNDSGDNDELLPKAIDIIMELGQASTSTIQRKLSVGYARAGRIMDQMEARGIVGPPNGSKPREIKITKEQYLELKNAGMFEQPIQY